jgi:hypothetical protein
MSRIAAERLRALVPTVLAGLCWLADVPGGPWLLAIGLAGAVFVWREDGLAPLGAWTARFPRAPWERVERLPSGEERRMLVRVCEAVQGAMDDLAGARGAPSLDPRAVRGELAGLLALAADLGAQLEQLSAIPGGDARTARIRATLDAILPAIERLRGTLRRAAAPGTSPHRPGLGSLLTLERELSAHQDCLDELEELPCIP